MTAISRSIAILATSLVLGCRSAAAISVSPGLDISFHGFAEEALFGRGTARTHLFDDYTEGSYHVDPPEVARDLFKVAPEYGLALAAVVVIGPTEILWTYDVVSIVQMPGCSRVNWLRMPHARITQKWSGCVQQSVIDAFLDDLRTIAASETEVSDGCVLLAQGGNTHWSRFDCIKYDPLEMQKLERTMSALGAKLEITYSAYPPPKPGDDYGLKEIVPRIGKKQ